ncbi:MAG: 2-dehydropantoate 2-reductase [Alphaproteobacteria bacterium]|nr:2-dehydropantoate 2-reductase [Alphaproteobacteria bacterium]
MKICIVGAGAIGGVIAVYLARAGHEVSVVARGAHLAAIRTRGLTLMRGDERSTHSVAAAADDPAVFGLQDAVFITLKAHDIPAMLPRLAPLIGPETVVIPAINGLPWWYFHRAAGRFDGSAIECIDPGGAMLRALDPARIVGCMVMLAADMPEPGLVRQTSPAANFVIGESDGGPHERTTAFARIMTEAGMKVDVSADIRAAIWMKLLGNLGFNPVTALARARIDQIFAQSRLVDLIRNLMTETMAVGAAYGIEFPITIEQRLGMARKLGAFKSSMLQDVERGRPIEVEAILGTVVELARRVGIATPAIDAVYALAAGLDAALRRSFQPQ